MKRLFAKMYKLGIYKIFKKMNFEAKRKYLYFFFYKKIVNTYLQDIIYQCR